MAAAGVSGFLRRVRQSAAAGALAPLPDHDLLDRFLARNDDAAFLAVLHRHGPMVYRVCRRALRREQDAEDAFQATFLVLARKARSIRKRTSLAGWLHGTAHRVALKLRDSARRRKDREERTAGSSAVESDEAGWAEVRAILDDELQRLPDRLRDPLVLCYLEGRTQDEVAEHLGWSKSTVRRRLESGRAVLGRRLTGRGVTLAAALAGPLLSDCSASAAVSPTLTAQIAEGAVQVVAGTQAAAFPASVVALADAAVRSGSLARSAVVGILLAATVAGAGGWATLPATGTGDTVRTVSQTRPTEPRGERVGVPQRGGDDVRTSTRAAVAAAVLAGGLASAQDPKPVQAPVLPPGTPAVFPQPVPPVDVAPQNVLGARDVRVAVAAPVRPTAGSLILRPAVMDDLGLSKEQRAKLGGVWDDVQEEYADDLEKADAAKDARDPREILEAQRARIRVQQATAAALEKVLPDVLNAAQQARLTQIQIQVMGVHAFGDPDVQQALKLTDAQKEKFQGVVRVAGQVRVEAVRQPVPVAEEGGVIRAVATPAVLPQVSRDKLLEMLTDRQKLAWQNLIGKPFQEPVRQIRPPTRD